MHHIRHVFCLAGPSWAAALQQLTRPQGRSVHRRGPEHGMHVQETGLPHIPASTCMQAGASADSCMAQLGSFACRHPAKQRMLPQQSFVLGPRLS